MEQNERAHRLKNAVVFLIGQKEPSIVVNAIKAIIPAVAAGARFNGEYSVLNELLEVYNESQTAFRGVIRRVIKKRTEKDLSTREYKALLAGEPPEEREQFADVSTSIKNEFIRKSNAYTRNQLRRALAIHNNKLAYDNRLRGTERLAWEQKQWKAWTEERERYIREGTTGRLSREYMAKRSDEFWEKIEAQLSKAEGR